MEGKVSGRERARFQYQMMKYRNKKIDWTKTTILFVILDFVGLLLVLILSNKPVGRLLFEGLTVISISFVISIIITRELLFSKVGYDELLEKTNLIKEEMDQGSLEEYYIVLLNGYYDYYGVYENFKKVLETPYLQKIDTYSQLNDLFIVLDGYKNYVKDSTLENEINKFNDIFRDYHGIMFGDLKIRELRQLANNMKNTKNSFIKLIEKYEKQLTKIDESFENWHRLLKMIGARDEGVPISTNRISEVMDIPVEEVEDTLERLLLDYPDLGMFFKEDQTFTKGKLTLMASELPDLEKLVQTKTQACTSCETESSLVVRICPKCKSELPLCEICKQGYSSQDVKSLCLECNNIFHYTHFHEVVRVTGNCPVCRKDIKQKDVKPLES